MLAIIIFKFPGVLPNKLSGNKRHRNHLIRDTKEFANLNPAWCGQNWIGVGGAEKLHVAFYAIFALPKFNFMRASIGSLREVFLVVLADIIDVRH